MPANSNNLTLTPPPVKRKIQYTAQNFTISSAERQTVAEHLITIGQNHLADWRKSQRKIGTGLLNEAHRYTRCGSHNYWQCENCQKEYSAIATCKSRICPECSKKAVRAILDSLKNQMDLMFGLKKKGWCIGLLTLTTTTARFGDQPPTRKDIARFYRESSAFMNLFFGKWKTYKTDRGVYVDKRRYRTAWKDGQKVKIPKPYKIIRHYDQVKPYRIEKPHGQPVLLSKKDRVDFRKWLGRGYFAVIEFGADNYMLHCHAITYGPYVYWKKLRKTWEEITGDSYRVDIRPCKSKRQAAHYVLKYVTKPPITESYYDLAAYAAMIKGTRRIRTGGIFYNTIRARKPEKMRFCCPYCDQRLFIIASETELRDDVPNIYELLRERGKGPPLKDPDLVTMEDRLKAEIYAKLEAKYSQYTPVS